MAAGQTVTLTTTATWALDAATTQLAQTEFGWASYDGTIRATPSGSEVGLDLTVTATDLGSGPGGTSNASVTGSALLRPTTIGPFTPSLGDLGRVHSRASTGVAERSARSCSRRPAPSGRAPTTAASPR